MKNPSYLQSKKNVVLTVERYGLQGQILLNSNPSSDLDINNQILFDKGSGGLSEKKMVYLTNMFNNWIFI